jgi:hypothetical protein
MRPIGSLALGLALVSGAAQAQTTVTRQVTSEPVETVVTQGPDGAAITRRILSPEPGIAVAGPARAVETETYVEPAPRVTSRQVTTTRRVTSRKPARARTATTRTAPTSRTVVRSTTVQPPLDRAVVLTPAQRQIVYRTVAPREVYPAPVIAPMGPPIVAQTDVVEPNYPLRSIYPADESYDAYSYDRDRYNRSWEGRPAVQAAPIAVSYSVGSRLPQTVPLVGVPNALALQIPSIAPYSYARVGNRGYLVDPASSVIVADVTE